MLLFTGFIVVITLLNIIVYYLRQRQEGEEEDYGERKYSSSLLLDQQCHPLSLLSDHQCRRFLLAEIKSATQDFDEALVIGKGGFGKVYIGIIENVASTVAIKRLDFGSNQGAPEFWTEIEMLSKFRHSHLVSLIGYCNDHHEMIIVYEYMPNGTLGDNLHKILRSNRDGSSPLSWVQRLKICIGAARGLDYLHTGIGTLHGVIHRDVKSSNILLDENMEAKISDFGLCKIGPTNQPCTHVSTNVKGTFGYLDPDYFLTRRLTRKSDVYAFGVVLLEVLCGRPAVDVRLYEEQWGLAEWAKHCIKGGKIDLLVDPSLKGSILSNCLDVFSHIADQCLENCSKRRPTMTEVVSKLEFALELQERANSSGAEAGNISTEGASDNQDSMNSYSEKALSNPCPSIDSFVELGVVDAHNSGHSHGQINGVLHLGDRSRVQSRERPAKKMTFVKKVRLFFSPKDHSISAADDIFKERDVLRSELLPFDFGIIRIATDNFADTNMLGRGGFGSVYKGRLQNGQEIAVKMLSRNSRQGEVEFINEVMIMGKLYHKNLVRLLGFSVKRVQKLLVYEFVPNGSLDHFIFDPLMRPHLGWDRRYKIIGAVARGLLYLHEDSSIQIIHRDIKPSNILIDAEFNPKISDFGLASPQNERESECITDNIVGTMYMAPEYLRHGHFSVKSDVFSFGILVLEIISGKKMNSFEVGEGAMDLLSYAWRHWREGTPLNLVDLTLGVGPSVEVEVVRCIQIGLLCVQESTVDRPTIASVVVMLSSLSSNLPEPSEPAFLIRGNNNLTRSPFAAYSSGTYSITELYPR